MNTPIRESTGAYDRHGKEIFLGDTVRRFIGTEFFDGIVVFENCAFRILIKKGFHGEIIDCKKSLKFNYSLLWDENTGTTQIEKIEGALEDGI